MCSGIAGNWPILSGQARCFVSLRMSSASGDEVLDGVDGVNSAAGADCGAVERGRGTGKIELALQGPALQESVDKTCVKNVSGAGGVNGLHAKSGGVMELRAIPGQYTFFTQCRRGKAAAKTFPERGQRLPQIRFFHQPPRDIPAGDEVVHALQEYRHAGVNIVHVGDDRNADGASPTRRCSCSGCIVPIDVKGAGVHDPVLLEFFSAQSQALVPFPKDGAFAGVIHENESLLAGTTGSHEEMSFDAEARKFGAMERCGAVVTNFAHVTRAQTPLLAGNHGGGDLAAGQDFRGAKFDLTPAFGIMCDGNQ